MATSGTVNTSAYSNRYLSFTWSQTSQDYAKNTTTISYTLKGAGSASEWYATGPIKLMLDNETVYSSSARITLDNGTVVTSGSYTFTHGSDGRKTFNVYIEAAVYTYAINCYAQATETLQTIPRASSLTAANGTLGTAQTLTITPANSSFKHRIQYVCGSANGYAAGSATAYASGTSISWTPPLSLASQNTTGTSVSIQLSLWTYTSDGTYSGVVRKTITCTMPASVKPSCTMTLEDVSGVDDIYGSPVQGLSWIKITVNTTTSYGSAIAAYNISANGARYTSTPATTKVLATAGDSPVNVTVTDKRGRTGSASYTMKVQAYTRPAVSQLVVHRCDADGTENEQGDYIRVTWSAVVSPLSNKNTAAYSLRYKATTASTYTTVSFSDLANVYTVTGRTYIFKADSNLSYDVEVTATDRHHSATKTTSASTAFTLMNWGPDGTSMGIGKVAEEADTMEVGLKGHFYQSVQMEGNRYSLSTPGVAGTAGYILMARIVITAANADTPITFIFTRRQANAAMTVYARFSNATATESTLASIRYEGDNYGAFLVQVDALTWELYVQKGSAYDTVTLQEWWTSKTMESRVAITFPGTLAASLPGDYYRATPLVARSIIDLVMPVGFVLTLYSHADPADMYPGTTWTRITNAFLWATTSGGTIGQTGGEETHTLTVDELPAHDHGSVYSQHAGDRSRAWYQDAGSNIGYGRVSTGGGKAHNNMPPYIQVSVWRRTA
jgi:hypothetical protein